MKTSLNRILAVFLVSLFLLTSAPSAQAYEGNCVCAGCDRPCGSGHASNCPYGGGGGGGGGDGDSESRGGASFERAPIFVAPVGMAGGIFMGGVWWYKQMAGDFNDIFVSSYNSYMSVPPSDEWAAGAFTFGLRMGGVPWLALYVPTGAVRYGVVNTYKAATKPSKPKPKPVDPNIAVYNLIAQNYADLSKSNDEELNKAKGDVEAAVSLRTRKLDEHIAGSQELRELREKEGVAAARARAEKQLEAYSRARAEKQKLAQALTQSIHEKDDQIKQAIKDANPASFLADLKLATKEIRLEKLLEDKSLPQSVQDSLKRELKVNKALQNLKQGYDIGSNVIEVAQSYRKAQAEGKDAVQWIEDREARQNVWRLKIKLLSVSLSPQAGIVAGSLESSVDIAYAATAGVLLGSQVDAEMATLEKLRTANVFQDAMADDWDEVNVRVKAAREKEEIIRKRGEQYRKMQKENESYANALRSK